MTAERNQNKKEKPAAEGDVDNPSVSLVLSSKSTGLTTGTFFCSEYKFFASANISRIVGVKLWGMWLKPGAISLPLPVG